MEAKTLEILEYIIEKTNTVPYLGHEKEEPPSGGIARALDVALMGNKFKLSTNLFSYITSLSHFNAQFLGKAIIKICKKKIGSHVLHNTYFKDFPIT